MGEVPLNSGDYERQGYLASSTGIGLQVVMDVASRLPPPGAVPGTPQPQQGYHAHKKHFNRK